MYSSIATFANWVSNVFTFLILFLALAFCIASFADQLPQSLSLRGEKIIFVDLAKVTSVLNVNVTNKTTEIKSSLTFTLKDNGRPFIMLPQIAQNLQARWRGRTIKIEHLNADQSSPLGQVGPNSYILENMRPGTYRIDLEYKVPLADSNLLFNRHGELDFFTTMSDLKASGSQFFMDATFPTNLLYDTYKFKLKINVIGSAAYEVLSNGQTYSSDINQFELSFPDWYISNSFFIHLFKKGTIEVKNTSLTRVDGSKLPTSVECEKGRPEICQQVVTELQEYLLKHEQRLGRFPHDRLIARICNGKSCHSMEYSGALETRYSDEEHVVLNLEHELLHSWFGRSVQFRSGGDSWLDEAIVIWAFIPKWPDVVADKALVDSLCEIDTYPYAQYTSGDPYRWGPQILERIDRHLVGQGGLLPVLRQFHNTYKRSTISQREFFDFVINSANDRLTRTKLEADLIAWFF